MQTNKLECLVNSLHGFSLENSEPKDNKESNTKFKQLFLDIVFELMNRFYILAGDKKYRIIDCEVYYNDSCCHQDPYLYGYERQKKMLHWCFHYSGIDLTIGNNDQISGGILLRGLREIPKNGDNKFLDGPLKLLHSKGGILNELCGNAFVGKGIFLERHNNLNLNNIVLKTKMRQGLDKKKQEIEIENFQNKPELIPYCKREYRYFIQSPIDAYI